MSAGAPTPHAVLVVGDGPLAQAVAARLAAVAHVALGATNPARAAPALAEVERVLTLYGRSGAPTLAVAQDVPSLVRCARRLLPDGHAVVLIEPPPVDALDAALAETAPGTTVVHLTRGVADGSPERRALDEDRVLWTIAAETSPAWAGMRGHTAHEVSAARTVRQLLFPDALAA